MGKIEIMEELFFCGVCQKGVNPTSIYYSCPLQGDCPECGERLEEINGSIKVLEAKEAFEARPEMYAKWKEEEPEEYEKSIWKEEYEVWLKEQNK